LRCALFPNISPRANPISVPIKVAIATLSEDAVMVLANRKPTYAMHRVHKIRRRFISGIPSLF